MKRKKGRKKEKKKKKEIKKERKKEKKKERKNKTNKGEKRNGLWPKNRMDPNSILFQCTTGIAKLFSLLFLHDLAV